MDFVELIRERLGEDLKMLAVGCKGIASFPRDSKMIKPGRPAEAFAALQEQAARTLAAYEDVVASVKTEGTVSLDDITAAINKAGESKGAS